MWLRVTSMQSGGQHAYHCEEVHVKVYAAVRDLHRLLCQPRAGQQRPFCNVRRARLLVGVMHRADQCGGVPRDD